MPRRVLAAALSIIALHLLLTLFLPHPQFFSSMVLGLASAIGAIACYWRSLQTSGAIRTKWNFAAMGLALWTIGQIALSYQTGEVSKAALPSDFYFFLYGIPLLLAISSSHTDHEYTSLLVLDSLQAVLAVCLAYVQLFAFQGGREPSGLGNQTLMAAYFIEHAVLVLAGAVRLLARPRGEAKLFYWLLFGYLLSFFVAFEGPVIFTRVTGRMVYGTWLDVVHDLPFLLLAVAVVRAPRNVPEEDGQETNSIALLMDNCSPVIFTLAVLAIGASITRHHFRLGMASITFALVIYCFRAAILQSAYMRTQIALTGSQHALSEANARLEQLSLLDALTGIPNRRQFDLALAKEWDRAVRFRTPLALMMIDIDFFKKLNDHYGHQYGDVCLAKVATALRKCMRRPNDLIARYGGEEFAVVLPNVDSAGALQVAEKMRQSIAELRIPHTASTHRVVTASIGIAAQEPRSEDSAEALLAAADAALYRAKCSGRDRIEIAAENALEGRAEIESQS